MSRVSSPSRQQPRLIEAVQARHRDVARALFLLAAFASFVLSVSLWFAGNELEGIFVGIWVPSIISLGAFLMPRGAER
jgi:hypothetical protein